MEPCRWSRITKGWGWHVYTRGLVAAMALGLPGWRFSLAVGNVAEAQADRGVRARDELPASALDTRLDLAPGVVEVEDVATLRGVQPTRKSPAAVDAEVKRLIEERAGIVKALPANVPATEIRSLVEDPLAPPRMDSGDPDPDRLEAAPSEGDAARVKGAEQ